MTPWGDLEKRYATSRAVPAMATSSGTITVAGKRAWGFFTQDGSAIEAFDATGVYLFPVGPKSAFDRAVHIPTSVVTGCSRFELFGEPRTALWIDEAQAEVEFHHESGTVLSWCIDQGVAIMGRGTLLELLHGTAESDGDKGVEQ